MKSLTKNKTVIILGAPFNTGNMGVNALGASLVHLLKNVSNYKKIYFFTNERHKPKMNNPAPGCFDFCEYFNYRLTPFCTLKENIFWILFTSVLWRISFTPSSKLYLEQKVPILGAFSESKYIVDVRGGDSFSDIYGLKRLLYGTLPFILCSIMKKPYVLLPQTYGPFYGGFAKAIARTVCNNAAIIMARDNDGPKFLDVLTKGKVKHDQVIVSPDVAFALEVQEVDFNKCVPEIFSSDSKFTRPILGLNVSGLLFCYKKDLYKFFLSVDYRVLLIRIIETFVEEKMCNVLLIPHVTAESSIFDNDYYAIDKLLELIPLNLKNNIFKLNGKYNQSELKCIIGRCDYFIGSRMHSCIASASQGIPTAALAYSKKFKGVFDNVNLGGCVFDISTEGEDDTLRNLCRYLFNTNQNVVNTNSIQNDLSTAFEKLI